MKFQKKTERVEAVKWTGDNIKEVVDFLGEGLRTEELGFANGKVLVINSNVANLAVSPESYIVKKKGAAPYVCAAEAFLRNYELKEE